MSLKIKSKQPKRICPYCVKAPWWNIFKDWNDCVWFVDKGYRNDPGVCIEKNADYNKCPYLNS